MSVPLLGSPALRGLALLKLRAVFRRALRRLRQPAGALFALVGLVLMGGWMAVLFTGAREHRRPGLEPELLLAFTQAGLAVLLVVTLLSAVGAKGLYLPREDLERLLSAPVSRADLVRYRMQVDVGRSLFGAIIFALLVFGRMPVPLFAFLGVLLAMLTLSVARTAAALLVGAARGGFEKLLGSRRLLATRILVGLVVWAFVMLLVVGEDFLPGLGLAERPMDVLKDVLSAPATQVLLLPLAPWARAITAATAVDFALWGGLAAALYLLLFELTARLPIDYREISIETSLDVTRRLTTMREQGGIFGGISLSKDAGDARVPWLLGRSPFGAVAWIQLASIRRKARGTILVSLLVVGLVTFFATVAARGDDLGSILVGAAIIALGGTVYLCSGLRFDFRSSLDRMEIIKAWPLPPWRIFLATILPELLLASLLLALAILLRAAVTGAFHPWLLGVIALLPLLTLTWVALDNAVFLFAPVRFIPGQEGALHHMGRTMLLVLLRVAIFGAVAILTGVAAMLLVFVGSQWLDLPETVVVALAVASGLAVLILLDMVLIAAGGWLLQRFDVSRGVA